MVTHKEKNRVAQKRFRQRQKVTPRPHCRTSGAFRAGETTEVVVKHRGGGEYGGERRRRRTC